MLGFDGKWALRWGWVMTIFRVPISFVYQYYTKRGKNSKYQNVASFQTFNSIFNQQNTVSWKWNRLNGPIFISFFRSQQQCPCLHITAIKSDSEGGDKPISGEPSWFLGGNPQNQKFISVGEFMGQTRVDLRVYYKPEDDTSGKLYPTKKGINLSLDEYEELKSVLSEVDSTIKD